jgi:hypothetical protein
VYALVRAGKAFRDAYREVKEGEHRLAGDEDHAAEAHLGAPGTEQEAMIRERLRDVVGRFQPFVEGTAAARALLD